MIETIETRDQFIARCEALHLDADGIALALMLAHPLRDLEAHWYEFLALGSPDLQVYSNQLYLADLWICWQTYSRRYITCMERLNLHPTRIVDVGCGLGYSTAALKKLYPQARVYATNLFETPQFDFARLLSGQYNFELVQSKHISEDIVHADLIFASEYFEHFMEPVLELEHILTLDPRELVIANTFGQRSIGHFDTYVIGGEECDGKKAGRKFNDALRIRGYRKVETLFWNDRPSFWQKIEAKK